MRLLYLHGSVCHAIPRHTQNYYSSSIENQHMTAENYLLRENHDIKMLTFHVEIYSHSHQYVLEQRGDCTHLKGKQLLPKLRNLDFTDQDVRAHCVFKSHSQSKDKLSPVLLMPTMKLFCSSQNTIAIIVACSHSVTPICELHNCTTILTKVKMTVFTDLAFGVFS